YILQQNNGELYLAHGYYDYSEKEDPGSDDSYIRRLYKLAPQSPSASSSVSKWFDYLAAPNKMHWDGPIEITLPEFPDVVFRCEPEKMEAIIGDALIPLYSGMPIWNCYFCDITGDGFPELCSTVSWGSGMIDNRVIIYDHANGVSYSLKNRGASDYMLRQNEKDGRLYVDKRAPIGGELLSTGPLLFKDGHLQLFGETIAPLSIGEITDPTDDPNFSYDTAVEIFFEGESNEYYFGGLYSQDVIVHYTDGTQEDIETALKTGRATIDDLDKFGIRYWAEPKAGSLEAAISSAILDHYASDKPNGLIHVESHVLLANEAISGTPLFGADDHAEQITTYLLVHHVKYSTYGGTLEAVGGSYVPTAITFKITASGEYVLEEYWEPRDGAYYVKDIRDKFPGASADDALNDQAYIEDLKAETYNKALAYQSTNPSLDVRIAKLLDTLHSAAVDSSKPLDQLREHEGAYEELLSYGKYTLHFCFSEFLMGGQADLRGQIMSLACQDIMLAWGEAYIVDWAGLSGQDWFAEFRSNAESLSDQINHEELEKMYPAAFLLLQMSDSEFMTTPELG
ncbi:MAG: hypothetical protein Q4B50_04665, partial [Bacillota bacterium]|nr:hypothetical protein [Bacillota bacterium]